MKIIVRKIKCYGIYSIVLKEMYKLGLNEILKHAKIFHVQRGLGMSRYFFEDREEISINNMIFGWDVISSDEDNSQLLFIWDEIT